MQHIFTAADKPDAPAAVKPAVASDTIADAGALKSVEPLHPQSLAFGSAANDDRTRFYHSVAAHRIIAV